MDLTEAEDIKKRWQEYTEEMYHDKLEVATFGGIIRDTQFGAEVELELLFPEAQAEPFLERLTDMTAATVEGMETGKEYRAFPIDTDR